MPIARTKEELAANMRDILQSRSPPGLVRPRSMEAFKSHVDGSVVTNQKELNEHNRKNDVIDIREWGNDSYCDLAAKKEREEFYLGTSKKEQRARIKAFSEATQKVEQGYKPNQGEQ